MMSEVDRTLAFLDSLARLSSWIGSWDKEILFILQSEKFWGDSLTWLAESCITGGAASPKSRIGHREMPSALKSPLMPLEEVAAKRNDRELPRKLVFESQKTAIISFETRRPSRAILPLPDPSERLDRSALSRLAGDISEPEYMLEVGAVSKILRRNIRSISLPQVDLITQRRWMAGLSGKALGALGRIKPDLLVLLDRSASAKPPGSKKGLIEDKLSPSPESKRAPIDLLARFSEKYGHVSIDGRGGFRQEIDCQFPFSANKASQQEAGISPASRKTSEEALEFSASSGAALDLGMQNKLTEKSLQPATLSRAANPGNWPNADHDAFLSSTQIAGLLPAQRLPSGEAQEYLAASRKALDLSILNKSEHNETEYGNAQDETVVDIPESSQPIVFFGAKNEGETNWPLAASSRESLSDVGIKPVFQPSPGEESASAISWKALDLKPAAFSKVETIGNWPLAACKTSRLVFGIPLMQSLVREEADTSSSSSSIAISTKGGEPAKSLLSLKNQRETACDEDLDALADKIKRILQEEARRHGIDV